MIRAGRRPRDRSEQMILNNYLAMDAIRRLRDKSLTDDAVMDLHTMITTDTLDDPDDAGRVQRPADQRVLVWDTRDQTVLHSPPPAEDLAGRMREMVRFANRGPADGSFLHPVLHAIVLHFWIAYDHPFADGNGRTARALFYWAMLHHKYWMFEFASISNVLTKAPGQYARSFLHTETDDNDLTYFFEHQLGVILRAIADVESYITRKTEQVRQVEETLKRSTNLNHRQLALLAHAIRHPNAEYTIRSHMTSHTVAYATARADLFRLADLGLLERRRVGRRSYLFWPPPTWPTEYVPLRPRRRRHDPVDPHSRFQALPRRRIPLPGHAVLTGPNDTGKTTMLQATIGTLFGYRLLRPETDIADVVADYVRDRSQVRLDITGAGGGFQQVLWIMVGLGGTSGGGRGLGRCGFLPGGRR